MKKEIIEISRDKLKPNDIIRADIESRTFDYNIDTLRDSIKARGVLTPLLVAQDDSKYIIIDGNRRYAAGVRAGLKIFPCIVSGLKKDDFAGITELGFSANELRQDLTPSQETEALRRVCEKGGLTLVEIAESTGKTIDQLFKMSSRKNLHEEVVSMLDEGEISRSATHTMTSLSREEQKEVMDTFETLDIQPTQRNIAFYRGQKHGPSAKKPVSEKVIRKIQDNIGVQSEELSHLKKYYRDLQEEIKQAHEIVKKIWKVPELNDYMKENHPKIHRDFKNVLNVLGY